MSSFLKWYMGRLVTHPMSTNCISYGLVSSAGDMLCQTYEKWDLDPIPHKDRSWYQIGTQGKIDLRRSLIQWSFGTFIGTPFFFKVYGGLDKALPQKTMLTALQKGTASWVVGTAIGPVFFTYATVTSNLLLHNRGHYSMRDHVTSAKNKVERDWMLTAKANLAFWSPHWIPMFYLLAPQYRLLYSSLVNVFWQAVLSSIQYSSPSSESKSERSVRAQPAATTRMLPRGDVLLTI